MANEIWQQEEIKFLKAIEDVKIPNAILDDVAFVTLKSIDDLEIIPQGGGCYWIWTNEPVLHTFHKNTIPRPFNDGEIIYNGIAKDDVRSRVKHHLFGDIHAVLSGISLDIYFGNTLSHRKKALSVSGKVPFIKTKKAITRGNKNKGLSKGDEIDFYIPIRTREDCMKLYLSDNEKIDLRNLTDDRIYFRNGINITDPKHQGFDFKVYYITGLSSLYLDFIEKKWRYDNKWLPKLCSYSSGR